MKEELYEYVNDELNRQRNNIELIASENYVSQDVLNMAGSILTNKYAEGYSGKRYYGGCENIDKVENLAKSTLMKLFDVKYVNVQPHSGSAANMAVYKALLNIGDKVMGMDLNAGGHLTHGHHMSFSGLDYEIVSYKVDPITELIDYDLVKELALKEKPKMIIAGASAYSREIDFKKFREIADLCGAYLMVDMAHIAGLVATKLHMSPIPYADVVTSTTHKTLRGTRGGIILTNDEEISKKIDKMVFPGIQGGPLEHIVAAKAMAFIEALEPSFLEYQKNVIDNAKTLCDKLKSEGFRIVTDGTDNHLMLVDIMQSIGISGKEAETILDSVNITVNKNSIPNDTLSPFKTSGIRLGTPAMTTRGFTKEDFVKTGELISLSLKNRENEQVLNEVRDEVKKLVKKYKLY